MPFHIIPGPAAALTLSAEGVLLGTRFLAAD